MNKTDVSRIPARCGNCAHWTKHELDEPNQSWGECHRYPPKWIRLDNEGDATCSFPVTDSLNYCGEFKIRQDA